MDKNIEIFDFDPIEGSDSDNYSNYTEDSHHNSETEDELSDPLFYSDSDESNSEITQSNDQMIRLDTDKDIVPESDTFDQIISSSSQTKTLSHNIIRFKSGPKVGKESVSDVLSAFKIFFTEEMLQMICKYTNQKITNIDHNKHKQQSYMGQTDPQEMLAFIGVCLLIGVHRSVHEFVKDLWDTNGRGRDIFRCVMPLKRFQFLNANLCFDHINSRESRKEAGDKLALFSEIFNIFRKNCRRNYEMSENVTIDEMLRAFRGKVSFKQYMPSKPAKYGLKFFIICDSINSYCYDAILYTGRQSDGKRAINLAQNIVLELSKPLRGSGRNITCDNWFTSFPLAHELLKQKLTILGTIRKNKKEIPKSLTEKKKRVLGSTEAFHSNGLTVLGFYPKKNKTVLLLSTMHEKITINSNTNKPHMIEDYNHTKGGVDTLDQMCSTYSSGRWTKRWPTAAFFALLDIMAVNSYIIFKHFASNCNTEPIESKYRREFLHSLGKDLVLPHMIKRLKSNNISRELRTKITQIGKRNLTNFESTSSGPSNQESSSVLDKRRKLENPNQTRCYLCSRKENKVCSIRCADCDQLICKNKHMVIYCTKCADKDYLDND